MFLVTGAAGKTGQAVIAALLARGAPVRALVHRAENGATLAAQGVREVVVGDLQSPAEMARACEGIEGLYLICPNVHPAEEEMGRVAIGAARAAGVAHLVYHSVFHPAIEEMPHHWQKMRVEAHLYRSGLPCTILQPAPYLQNLLGYRAEILQAGRLSIPYAPERKMSYVDLGDVAEVASRVLTERGHEGASYGLSGGDWLSMAEIAARVGTRLGTPVEAVRQPLETWTTRARAQGMGDYAVETLASMFRYYDRYGYRGNPRVLTALLGRAPAGVDGFLQRAFP